MTTSSGIQARNQAALAHDLRLNYSRERVTQLAEVIAGEPLQGRQLCTAFCKHYGTPQCQCKTILPQGGLCDNFEIRASNGMEAAELQVAFRRSIAA